MPTLNGLKKAVEDLIKAQGENAPCAYDIWTTLDVRNFGSFGEDRMADILADFHKSRSGDCGLTMEGLREIATGLTDY